MRMLRLLPTVLAMLVFFGIAVSGPALLLALLAQPASVVAGAAIMTGPVALIVWSTAASRALVQDWGGGSLVPATPEQVDWVALVATERGRRMPTLFLGPETLTHPLAVRGLRRWFVFASPSQIDEAQLLLDDVDRDRRTGDDRLTLVLGIVSAMFGSWAGAWRLVTRAVRPGVSAFDRVRMAGLLLLTPAVALGWGLAWWCVQVVRLTAGTRVVLTVLEMRQAVEQVPSAMRADLRGLGRGWRLSTMIANADVDLRARRTTWRPRHWWNTPHALSAADQVSPVMGAVRAVIGTVVLGLGTLVSWGLWPAQHIVWPWEQDPVRATVTEVQVEGQRRDSGLGLFGIHLELEYRPTVRTDDGRLLALTRGSQPAEVGDRLTVVPSGTAGDGEIGRGRSTHQDSAAQIVVLGLVYLGLACGVQRIGGGFFDLVVQRGIATADWDQRVRTGRRHRRRRPRAFIELAPERQPR
ncbi:hypothetical protein [Cellulomonas sp. NPDC089187]|uniref:hypothetical protein n=1 Tax=Cellulomonas sp. NPDC089187 TaxID=3154970 RepID=UPI00342973E5